MNGHWVPISRGPIICTFGIRNQDVLAQFLDRLTSELPTLNLLIVGEMRLSESVQPLYQKLRNQIHITGYLSEADVCRHLSASDVFFIPDLVTVGGQGGSSNKSTSLAAGLAAGLPVVGTLGDMNNTLLQQTPSVFMEDATDLNKLAKRLLALLNDSSMESRQHTILLLFFNQTLSWKAIVEQYQGVWLASTSTE